MTTLFNQQSIGLRFLAPEAASSGGGDPTSGTQADGKATDAVIKTPFDDIDLSEKSELDDATKAKITAAKAEFVKNVEANQKLSTDLATQTELARRFQGTADRTKHILEQLGGDKTLNEDQYLKAISEELSKGGFKPEQIEVMAPMWANILKRTGSLVKHEIGHDLAPFAASTLAREAESAFFAAQGDDPLGLLSDSTVRQEVWNLVKDRVEKGAATTSEIVSNLAKMVYMDRLATDKKGGKDIGPMLTRISTGIRISGSGLSQISSQPRDLHAAKTEMNDDTRNALAETFRAMNPEGKIMPKAFKK